jgi:hypothetical protein
MMVILYILGGTVDTEAKKIQPMAADTVAQKGFSLFFQFMLDRQIYIFHRTTLGTEQMIMGPGISVETVKAAS